MEEVGRLLDRAELGRGGLLVLSGPAGSGKTAVAAAAADQARRRGFEVLWASPAERQPGRLAWAQLLRDTGAPADLVAGLLDEGAGPLELDGAASHLASDSLRLIVIDDADRGGPDALGMLSVVAARCAAAPVAVIATAAGPLGLRPELRLGGLSERELAAALGGTGTEAGHALWLASRGLPGVALRLAGELDGLGEHDDPVVHLALHAEPAVPFLAVDTNLVRLLEMARARVADDKTRARVLARLARELLGDASAAARRRALADQALRLARAAGDPGVLAEVLDARLHALWDPQGAEDRLAAGSEIIDLARAAGDGRRERLGMFWRFVALMELGRVPEAESALAAFGREAATAGDAEAAVMVTARHAMLAILRGRFDEAARLAEEVRRSAEPIGMADAGLIAGTLAGTMAFERGATEEEWRRSVDMALAGARERPGHLLEALAARGQVILGRSGEAAAELERLLPRALAGSGPRWVGAMIDLAFVAAAVGNAGAAAQIYAALAPYRGRLVVWAGAVIAWGPVSHHLGMLAAALAASGDAARASACRRRAGEIAQRLGMAVLLERLGPVAGEWTLIRDGDDWLLTAGQERARLRDVRGLHYLRALLAAPGRDLRCLDLAAGGAGMAAAGTGPVLDATARRAYRRRLQAVTAALEAADRAAAARAEAERQALLRELRGAAGLGGRARKVAPEAERARVNVTRTLRAAIDRIAVAAPGAAAHLRASIRTGGCCRYDPAPGGPQRWRV